MSTCAAEPELQHMQQDALSPVQEALSPASSNPTTQDDQVLLATMQPVSVLDLPTKYHHSHHHPKYNHHYHNNHPHHHHHQDEPGEQSPEDGHPEEGNINLIYNDGHKTIMYTHDKEIIYESEADRVQVVQYPTAPRTPSPPRQQSRTLHLHYPQLQLDPQELPRALVNGNAGSAPTTTVLVLSELVAADPGQLANAVANMRAGRRSRSEEDTEDQPSGEDRRVAEAESESNSGPSGDQQQQQQQQEEEDQKRSVVMEGEWRGFNDNPLTAATAAMLHLQQPHQVAAVGPPPGHEDSAYLYEYYAKLPDKAEIKLPPTHELWSTGVMSQKLMDSSRGMETGQEGANGQELHHFLHQYNQQSPGLQGGLPLALSPQSQQAAIAGVKREPEDLSSSRAPAKRHKQNQQPDSPTPPGLYHHHPHQIQYASSYENPYGSLSPRLQTTYASSTNNGTNGSGLGHPEATAVYVTSDALPPLVSSGSTSLSTSTSSYSRYDVVPSSYATTHAIRSSSSSTNKVLTVDLPSPDSGIGADAITPRQDHHQPTTLHQSSFDYTELCSGGGAGSGASVVLESGAVMHHQPLQLQLQQGGQPQVARTPGLSSGATTPNSSGTPQRTRPWHDFGRQNDADKIQIPKVYSSYGFKYHLETPISTSQRREDDRITYINKGQFYGITLDYVPEPEKPMLKPGQTVKSVVMLMFREEKSPEDEIKAWQFWHGRQHSVKQRILDADTKNSVGLVGCIEEVAHNAIAIYWNPLESSAKINVAVQCLSTDFSSQKGVKGLPLHIQIDTYEDPPNISNCTTPSHRGYCQIKVFCDKGAERKTRDEERRAAKRKMTSTGRKKIDELYHAITERSEFYAMQDLHKSPVLFTPGPDNSIDKFSTMELSGFYGGGAGGGGGGNGGETDTSSLSNGEAGGGGGGGGIKGSASPYGAQRTSLPALKFHNHFPPDNLGSLHDKKDAALLMQVQELQGTVLQTVQQPGLTSAPLQGAIGNRLHMQPHMRATDAEERVMLYVRQESDEVYTPLHVTPPTVQGLLNAIESKYKIASSSINNLYRKNTKGITAKIDDDMIRYYVDEDLFLLEVSHSRLSPDHERRSPSDPMDESYDVTLIELPLNPQPTLPSGSSPHHVVQHHVATT